jgi:FKBP-type peptidyl-prolyl cis-trans isomerase FkpA
MRQKTNLMNSMKKILLIAAIAVSLLGCMKGNNESTCTYDECAVKAPDAEIQEVKDYLTANGISATQHCSGLFYAITQEGAGVKPTPCNYIVFNYEGKLTDGSVFQKTNSPAGLYLSQLITGFKNGIPFIKKGGKITLYIPPTLGYGNNPQPNIPPNSILIFDVELLDVR